MPSDTARELLRAGDPDGALRVLQDQVRAEPAEGRHRIFLFQLLSILGQWERALNQLNVAGTLDPGALGMVNVYRSALASEALRAQVFAGQRSPLVFGDPEPWVAMLVESVRLVGQGDVDQGGSMREQAFELAPANPGTVNGAGFSWLADMDERLGPVLEAVVNGRYYWIPMHRVAEITIDAPEDLRDLVWLPAQFTWTNGGQAVGLIPARYPGTTEIADPLVRMGRKTEWIEALPGVERIVGQRIFETDENEYPLLDVRQLKFDGAA